MDPEKAELCRISAPPRYPYGLADTPHAGIA